MAEPHERLQEARERAGFRDATAAARRFHWNENTYRSHENGNRALSRQAAVIYAKAFKVRSGWLLYGEGEDESAQILTVPLVGRVGAGGEAQYGDSQGPFEDVPAPEGSTEDTVAVEIWGDSLGSFFDRWLVFYDDVRDPPTKDLINHLCIVGLADGRVLIKRLQAGTRPRSKLFTLISQFDPPIYDVVVEWAARVKRMEPRS